MKKRILFLTCASAIGLFSLTSCGFEDNDTWDVIEYEGVPYTEERTAGRGVKYVLASLAPRKGPVLEPMLEETPDLPPKISLPVPMPEKIKNATPIFNDKVGKSK